MHISTWLAATGDPHTLSKHVVRMRIIAHLIGTSQQNPADCLTRNALLHQSRLTAVVRAPHPIHWLAQKDGEIALFGGEFFDSDTDRQLVFGDLFVFNCSKERWRKVIIPHRRAPQLLSL